MLPLSQARHGQRVRALRRIEDCPAARRPAPVKRNTVGSIEDVDVCSELLVVDFGRGAILCAPEEVGPV